MKEHPILFSSEMVKAILDGRKTQTRRVIKPEPDHFSGGRHQGDPTEEGMVILDWGTPWTESDDLIKCPYGKSGDRLWVREAWKTEELEDDGLDGVRYRADDAFHPIENTVSAADAWIDSNIPGSDEWRPSIFMPRWASRITLEVTDIRVQQLHQISTQDVVAEGIDTSGLTKPGEHGFQKNPFFNRYISLWDSINAQRGYPFASNPWVWVVDFKRILEGEK